ncbi:hypothetical protein AVEN_154262-1 [Araneus ventricosus]|uniref:Uncharacterized protein n=1 Tax=Araneus ventricosus TaxID=182803 RepID=A0A4Y2JIU2_ARAVE|nr:hypothetical protein AVEN_154262-1 [Araneus ventricosus]
MLRAVGLRTVDDPFCPGTTAGRNRSPDRNKFSSPINNLTSRTHMRRNGKRRDKQQVVAQSTFPLGRHMFVSFSDVSDSFLSWSRIHESKSGCGSGSVDSFRLRSVNGFIAHNY